MHAVREQTSCRGNLMGQCPNIENKQTKTDMSEDRRKKKKVKSNK